MPLIITALVHLSVLWIVGAVFQIIYLKLIRFPVDRVQLFLGRTPLRFKIGGCEAVLGWIPIGSSVAYDPIEFANKPFVVRLVGHVSSAILAMGAACAWLGQSQAWHHFASGFRQIVLGSWAPIDRATVYVEKWHHIAERSPVEGFGILAAKMAAFYVLPVGGVVITQILGDAATATGRESIGKLAVFNAVAAVLITILCIFAAIWLMVNRWV